MIRLHPPSTLFPYTTLFRSVAAAPVARERHVVDVGGVEDQLDPHEDADRVAARDDAEEPEREEDGREHHEVGEDRKSTRLNSSHVAISYAVFCLKKKQQQTV